MNVFYKDASEVTELTEPIQGYGAVGMAVLPGTKAVWRSEMVAPENVRLVDIYSHYHVNTVRMSAWKVTAAGERTLLYESYDWSEPGVVELNSVTENSPPNPDTFTTGGESGIWMVDAGDRLEWECEIDNQLDVTIVWANRALDAEMCNLRGNYAPSWGGQWFAWLQGHECGPDNPCEYCARAPGVTAQRRFAFRRAGARENSSPRGSARPTAERVTIPTIPVTRPRSEWTAA
jgi:hypothetical protein